MKNNREHKNNGKIRKKNYNELKSARKGINKKKAYFKNENEDERERLQKEINEKLAALVEENKRKQFEERLKEGYLKLEESGNGEDKAIIEEHKKNLTIIDKNVLTNVEFKSLPISKRTLKALHENKFICMTNIQAVSIPIVLLNKHVYAQAQTGTGKTFCFCIPLIEKLYRKNVSCYNKILEGVIVSPTRELVFQIFEVLNMLNKYHKLNICCVIGGKHEEREKKVFSYANIIVCTPGRLLFHLENNYYCNLDYISTFVIDEIDKMFDNSFYENLKSILEYKPKDQCQICLFSATMCRYLGSILKTFKITDYEYISINDTGRYIESNTVKQIYIECSIYDKINYLYTFLFSKKAKKVIVFFATCKQVRFMFEVFKKIKVGVMKFLQLHGKLKQTSRLNTYDTFSKRSQFVCLFTTDIACRGLDFTGIDWVIHFDFPESIETFIHRSGRTGRFTNEGNSLLFLAKETDNKDTFLKVLKQNNIEIQEKTIKEQRLFNINNKIHSLNAAFVDIKYLAKKALVIYLRHLYIVMKFRNLQSLDLTALAYAYGLVEFSTDMYEELNLVENKVDVKKKKSRLEKFLEIVKERRKKKAKQQELEEEEMENNNKEEKKEETKMLKEGNELNEQTNDDCFFIQQKVEIEENVPIMLPKKRKKRIKVAKALSNSVLFDDDANEITDEQSKFKSLIHEINGVEEHSMNQEREEQEIEEDEDEDENSLKKQSYIEMLKERVKKNNEKMKNKKLKEKEMLTNQKNHSTHPFDEDSSDEQNNIYSVGEDTHVKESEKDSKKQQKVKINKKKRKQPTEDINELESKVLEFL